MHSHQCNFILPYPFILTILILGVLSCSSWRCGIEEYVSWHSRMVYITTSKNNATSFRILVFCRIRIIIDVRSPRWGLSHWKATPTWTPPMNNSKKRVDHPSCAKRRCMNGCRLVSSGLVAKQLISSNGQFRVFLDVDLTRWHRYGRPWSFLWRRGSRWDLPGTPCSSSCWFAISGLMVLETSPFYPLIKTVLLLNRVSSILYFNPLAMGQYPSAA